MPPNASSTSIGVNHAGPSSPASSNLVSIPNPDMALATLAATAVMGATPCCSACAVKAVAISTALPTFQDSVPAFAAPVATYNMSLASRTARSLSNWTALDGSSKTLRRLRKKLRAKARKSAQRTLHGFKLKPYQHRLPAGKAKRPMPYLLQPAARTYVRLLGGAPIVKQLGQGKHLAPLQPDTVILGHEEPESDIEPDQPTAETCSPACCRLLQERHPATSFGLYYRTSRHFLDATLHQLAVVRADMTRIWYQQIQPTLQHGRAVALYYGQQLHSVTPKAARTIVHKASSGAQKVSALVQPTIERAVDRCQHMTDKARIAYKAALYRHSAKRHAAYKLRVRKRFQDRHSRHSHDRKAGSTAHAAKARARVIAERFAKAEKRSKKRARLIVKRAQTFMESKRRRVWASDAGDGL